MTAANLHKNNWMKHDKLNVYEGFHKSGSHILPLLWTQFMKKWEECSKCEYPQKSQKENWPRGSVTPQWILVIPGFNFQCLQWYLSKSLRIYQETKDTFLKRGLNFSIDLSSWELQKKVSHMSINMHRKIKLVFLFK